MNAPAGGDDVPRFCHRAFGLTIQSCLPLPELLAAPERAEPDVEITYGGVPPELPGAIARGVRFQVTANRLLLQVDGIARYLVGDGRTITIDRDFAADDDDIKTFLLASVFGALMHQRGDLVLHGSAIEWDGQCVVFLGVSGVGKSTLASAFRQKGHAILTDDLCVVRPGADGKMYAYPGFPQTKLWLDSLKQLDISAEGLRRIRSKIEKRALSLGAQFAMQPLAVRKLYVLRPHNRDEFKLTALQGPEKFAALKNNTYRFGFLRDIGVKAGHFQHALRLGQQAPVAAVQRPSGAFKIDELVALIETDLGI